MIVFALRTSKLVIYNKIIVTIGCYFVDVIYCIIESLKDKQLVVCYFFFLNKPILYS